ncbi:hypothetical protein NPIL_592311 [Nephila pilipes]|uniref:Uncharacterized protein n=1 Tax=Nephila pilipes TaxID=299642 RepID=A0A8X6NAG1_NEPPI|nr:hypothetical protein NPIL_592311 [Nephila pilipes]
MLLSRIIFLTLERESPRYTIARVHEFSVSCIKSSFESVPLVRKHVTALWKEPFSDDHWCGLSKRLRLVVHLIRNRCAYKRCAAVTYRPYSPVHQMHIGKLCICVIRHPTTVAFGYEMKFHYALF